MVRYLKCGRRSILLKMNDHHRFPHRAGAEALDSIDISSLRGDDEIFGRSCWKYCEDFSFYKISNPANRAENLNRLSQRNCDAFVLKVEDLSLTANRALAVGTKAESAEIWSEAFKHFFPIPSDEEIKEELAKSASNALATISFDPIVHVHAQTRGPATHVFEDYNKLGPIPKDCDIIFTLANARDLPVGALVEWTVRNEARRPKPKTTLDTTVARIRDCRVVSLSRTSFHGRGG